MEYVQELPLVFVQAFYLGVEDAFRVKEFVLGVLEVVCQLLLVVLFDFGKLVEAFVIVCKLF